MAVVPVGSLFFQTTSRAMDTARRHSLFRAVSSVITDGNIIHVDEARGGASRTSRVCVDRCVQDPQQVVTRNREGCGTALVATHPSRALCALVRGARRWSVWPVCPSSLKKTGPFFLSTPGHERNDHPRGPHWLVSRADDPRGCRLSSTFPQLKQWSR